MFIHKAICILALLLLSGCSRPASTVPMKAPGQEEWIRVVSVQVTQGGGVSVTGTTSLPDGACVRTRLIENDTTLSWWPDDVCIAASDGQWEIVVPLGRRGAPEALREDAQYAIEAWWPDHAAGTTTRFPFDLQGPPSP